MMSSIFNSTGHRLELPNIVSGDGVHLIDASGDRYVDLESGVWCASVGHGNKRVNAAIRAQLDKISHTGFCYSSPIVEEAAAALLPICQFDEGAAVLLCSGSEGIEYARQATTAVTGRTLTMTFHDAYLGSFSSVLNRTNDWHILDWEVCSACPAGRRVSECDHLGDIPNDVSVFMFEPGSSSGQVRFAPAPFVRRVTDAVRANGGKIIANEVTTGIGRTGSWFGFDHYGIRPDVIVIGKGIGNGYPVSAVVMNAKTSRELAATGFRYNQSHQNDPLGAAVVKETIAVIREADLLSKAATNGIVFLAALQDLMGNDAVIDVRGRGLMFAVDLRDHEAGSEVFHALLERGYIIGLRGATLRIDPPLITTQDDFLPFIDTLKEILAAV